MPSALRSGESFSDRQVGYPLANSRTIGSRGQESSTTLRESEPEAIWEATIYLESYFGGAALRNRTLTREQALREYPMYKIRYFEFHNFTNVFVDICESSFVPINPVDTKDIMRSVMLGLFYSLFDSNPRAINVFDIWIALHPTLKDEILAVWHQMEPHIKVFQKYRGALTFHMTNDPADFATGWEAFWDQIQIEAFAEAQRVFLVLNKKLAEMESSIEFREEIRKVLEQDPVLSQQVIGVVEPQTWQELILRLAFRELDDKNYMRFRNPPTTEEART